MSPELIKALIEIALRAYAVIASLKTTDPVAYEAALAQIGADHKAMLDRLEAAAAP